MNVLGGVINSLASLGVMNGKYKGFSDRLKIDDGSVSYGKSTVYYKASKVRLVKNVNLNTAFINKLLDSTRLGEACLHFITVNHYKAFSQYVSVYNTEADVESLAQLSEFSNDRFYASQSNETQSFGVYIVLSSEMEISSDVFSDFKDSLQDIGVEFSSETFDHEYVLKKTAAPRLTPGFDELLDNKSYTDYSFALNGSSMPLSLDNELSLFRLPFYYCAHFHYRNDGEVKSLRARNTLRTYLIAGQDNAFAEIDAALLQLKQKYGSVIQCKSNPCIDSYSSIGVPLFPSLGCSLGFLKQGSNRYSEYLISPTPFYDDGAFGPLVEGEIGIPFISATGSRANINFCTGINAITSSRGDASRQLVLSLITRFCDSQYTVFLASEPSYSKLTILSSALHTNGYTEIDKSYDNRCRDLLVELDVSEEVIEDLFPSGSPTVNYEDIDFTIYNGFVPSIDSKVRTQINHMLLCLEHCRKGNKSVLVIPEPGELFSLSSGIVQKIIDEINEFEGAVIICNVTKSILQENEKLFTSKDISITGLYEGEGFDYSDPRGFMNDTRSEENGISAYVLKGSSCVVGSIPYSKQLAYFSNYEVHATDFVADAVQQGLGSNQYEQIVKAIGDQGV